MNRRRPPGALPLRRLLRALLALALVLALVPDALSGAWPPGVRAEDGLPSPETEPGAEPPARPDARPQAEREAEPEGDPADGALLDSAETEVAGATQSSAEATAEALLADHTLLFPDLGVFPPGDVYLEYFPQSGRRLLRFTNTIYNVGAGDVEIRGFLRPDADTYRAVQRLYRYDGTAADKEIGEFFWHTPHAHWHFDRAFALHDLWAVGDHGEPVLWVAGGDKVTWCLQDTFAVAPSWAGTPAYPSYAYCLPAVQGIATGWADVYDSWLEGQFLDVTNVPDGVYALRVTVNPDRSVLETDHTNNVAFTYIHLTGARVSLLPPPEPPDTSAPDTTDTAEVSEVSGI